MSIGTVIFIVVLISLLLIGVTMVVNALSPGERASRTEHRQIKELQALVNRIDSLAYDCRAINPELSVQVIDEIRNYKLKELDS